MSNTRFGLTLVAALAFAAPTLAHAELVNFKATLDSAHEVPANASTGSGDALVTLDTATKKISYTATYIGLSGPAGAGHIHGPALAGANAGVLVPFASAASPVTGSATLTDAQIADLMAGKMYVNFHTAANKGGEIRGQLMKVK
jgi:hypothetical protein